jgi:hypothetical protein
MNRDKDLTRAYAETCLRVGKEYSARRGGEEGGGEGDELHRVDVIDTWGVMMAKVEAGECGLVDLLRDGLHLAAAGNDVSAFFSFFLLCYLSFMFFSLLLCFLSSLMHFLFTSCTFVVFFPSPSFPIR